MTYWKKTITVAIVTTVFSSFASGQVDPFGLGAPGGGGGLPGVGGQGQQQQQPQITPEQQQLVQDALNQAVQANAAGKQLIEQGDLDSAIEKFDQATALTAQGMAAMPVRQIEGIEDPRFEAALQKGKALRELGYTREALVALQGGGAYLQTVTDVNKIAPYFIEYGQVALEEERFNEAIQIFANGLSVQGQARNAELWFNKGKAEFEYVKSQQYAPPQQIQEDAQTAIQSLDRAIRFNPQYSEALLERGMAHTFLQDLETAMEDFEAAVAADPTNTDALARLGSAAFSRALSESNKRKGQRAAIDRDLQQSLTQMSSFLQQVPPRAPGEKDDGEEIGHEDVLLQRSAVYIALGDESQGDGSRFYQSALSDAEKVIELEPDAPAGYLQKATALRMLDDLDGALDAISETLIRSPNNPDALLRRAIILFRRGDYDGAMADLRTTILYTNDPRAHFWMALCYSRKDDPRMAIKHYSDVILYRPNFAVAQFNRGLAYMKLERYERAKQDFAEVLRNDPSNHQARSLRDEASRLAR